MEPRPQRPRPTPGTSQGQSAPQSAGGPASGAPHVYPEGADPTAFIAPPRTEYDYSPLDLAPPGQRRRRQLVGGVIAAFALLLIGAMAVFGYLLLRDDEPSPADDVAATQTAIAEMQATLDANQTSVANQNGSGDDVEGSGSPSASDGTAVNGGETAPTATVSAGPQSTTAVTQVGNGTTSVGPTSAELSTLLPAVDQMPTGLDVVEDSAFTEAEVAEALGGGRTAEQNLETWGWSGHAQRSFSASDPAALSADATTNITVSAHGFNSPASAVAALPFFSDILVNQGWEEAEAPALGDSARLLTTTNEDGTTLVALYVQQGNVMYRLGGSSVAGDPSESVLQVATAMFGGGE